jgi:hypothetical protein
MTDKYPIDVFMDAAGKWRARYSDGSHGEALTLDEMLDVLPYLREQQDTNGQQAQS